ncbi:MAG: hypothetical protein HYS44_00250 [Candidatus Niyogibacteria bacterium]|nr:hypothetical protein [Candidatus Niyogibacteria bacterium]
MKFESTPEHVGSGKPLESATEAVKRLAEKMADTDEAMEEARRAGDMKRAKLLKTEHERLFAERQKILREAAKSRPYKLAG